MDNLVFPEPAVPLILPRHHSTHNPKSRHPLQNPPPAKRTDEDDPWGNDRAHYVYYPSATTIHATTALDSASAESNFSSVHGQHGRRHSVGGRSPWSTIPPKHSLHMPLMKIHPEVWRSQHHQQDIHRLLHERREEEVMKRRGINQIMDTSEDEDESNDHEMSGVVMTMDLGGFKAKEEQEKALVREQVRQEWSKLIEQQTREYAQAMRQAGEIQRRNSWHGHLGRQHVTFRDPQEVLHPTTPMTVSFQQGLPDQLPPPAQQGRMGSSLTNPLSDTRNWTAAPPLFGNQASMTRPSSFSSYRG